MSHLLSRADVSTGTVQPPLSQAVGYVVVVVIGVVIALGITPAIILWGLR